MTRTVGASIKLSAPETREFWEIAILWEDEHLLALDKPSRLLTSPDRSDPHRPNLMQLLHRDITRGAPWARGRGLGYLANAHRLDFDSSGVILLAKEKDKRPSKLSVTYEKAVRTLDGVEEDSGLAGKTVIVERKGKQWQFRYDDDSDRARARG